MLEKFFAWSDGDGEFTERFEIDELLTDISVYWFSGNAASTLRIYQENSAAQLRFDAGARIRTPDRTGQSPALRVVRVLRAMSVNFA